MLCYQACSVSEKPGVCAGVTEGLADEDEVEDLGAEENEEYGEAKGEAS